MQPTHRLKIWKDKIRTEHECVLEPHDCNIDLVIDIATLKPLGYFNIDTNQYSWETDNVGFWISQIPVNEFMNEMKKKMYRAIGVRTSGPSSLF